MHFFNMSWDEALELPISTYNILVEQATNLMAGYRQGKFEFTTELDKIKMERAEYEAFKEFEKKGEN